MNRYYRQNLHNYLTPAERHQQMIEAAENSDDGEGPELTQEARERGRTRARPGTLERAVIPTRAEGGLGMIAISDAQKRQVKALEKKQRMKEGRMRDKMQWKTDRKGNFQKHFRDPLLQ
jgi:pre-60S factor REI1